MLKVGDRVLVWLPSGQKIRNIERVIFKHEDTSLYSVLQTCYSIDGYIFFEQELVLIPPEATVDQIQALIKLCQKPQK